LSTPSSKLGSSPNEQRLFNFVEKAFVATLGASLEQFAADIMAVLELKLKVVNSVTYFDRGNWVEGSTFG
jgi:hypothetical protein